MTTKKRSTIGQWKEKPFQIQLSNLNSNPIILYIHIYSLAYTGLADSIEILFYLFCIHVTKSCSICLARDDVIADMYLYQYLVCMGKTTQLLGINFPNKRIPKHLLTKKIFNGISSMQQWRIFKRQILWKKWHDSFNLAFKSFLQLN